MKIITMLLVLVIAIMCVCGAFILADLNGYDSPFEVFGVAGAEELPTYNFNLPAGYSTWDLTVSNTINEISFEVVGCYAFDRDKGAFNVRVYQSELDRYMHYLQIGGYEFVGFNGWTLSTDGQYYQADYISINSAALSALYTQNSYTVTFMDGKTNTLIQSLVTSYGSEVKAPNAPDYSADGYVFTGWEGGDYTNVTRNITVYSVNAPSRYITSIKPDGSRVQIAAAQGSCLADVAAPEYESDFKYWRDTDGYKVDAASVIVDYDMTLEAIYGSTFPGWAKTLLIALASLAGAGLIIYITVKILKRKVSRTA